MRNLIPTPIFLVTVHWNVNEPEMKDIVLVELNIGVAENNIAMEEGTLEIGMEYRTVSGVAGPLVILDKVKGPRY
ncbi:putative P-type H(+)-exporting transporter [Salvia divinorum]|uniref:P-type H(+)-exporting transporter n=1 Tax=Salvia divinorum TaxID=28513 RepID=A0ABD1GDA1_SALDI